jgi:3-phosphoshikimate 1-carboxyvinyltransferase
LRVKETDRIAAMAANLRRAGVTVVETPDGMEITGVERLSGCQAESFGDHRIAMSMLVAGLAATGETSVDDTECIATSFPGFLNILSGVVPR